jgi:hypothetical protein
LGVTTIAGRSFLPPLPPRPGVEPAAFFGALDARPAAPPPSLLPTMTTSSPSAPSIT